MDNIDLRSDEIQDILAECYKSTKILAKTLLPERFYAPFTVLHDDIFDLIDSGAPLIAIAAPRGIGKTSLVGLAKTTKNILYRDSNFIPYVSCSHDAAMLQTENLKRELTSNQIIRKIFGAIKTKNVSDMDESFSKKSWVGLDTLVMPRGAGQQIRGILYKNYRPDLIIIDDFEDPEAVHNENLRKKYKEWFHADLLKATSRFDKNFQIIYIDTLKHEDSLLQDLLDNPDWESIRLEICDDNYEPTAPEFFSKEDIIKEVEYHRHEGILDVFYREYRNLPISTEDPVFNSKDFRHFREFGDYIQLEKETSVQKDHWKNRKDNLVTGYDSDPFQHLITVNTDKVNQIAGRIPMSDLLNVVIADPAKTAKLQSADSAIIGIGVQRSNQQIFIRRVVSGKMYPDEFYDAIFKMCLELNAMVLGVEVTGLNEYISQPIQNEMKTRNIHIMFEELKSTRSKTGTKAKEERVATLAPYYRHGYVYHNIECCDKLEAQLIGFPRSKLWDCMDAEAYIITLIDRLNWMFDPPDMDDDNPDTYYKDLKNESPLIYKQII